MVLLYQSFLALSLTLMMFSMPASSKPVPDSKASPGPELKVKLSTTMGDIVLRLDQEKAPVTVENFLHYVETGFYKDLVFHRVIPGFMVQAGGMTSDMGDKEATRKPIKNESSNQLSNRRGTIAMARTSNPGSATSQFFINVVNNTNLDYRSGRQGYAVFGEVVEGMEVVDEISKVETSRRGPHANVPVKPIVILKAEKLAPKASTQKK